MPRDPVSETRRWIERIVMGLNLCPFARRVFDAGKIRYAVSAATGEDELLVDLEGELLALSAASPQDVETTILIHPFALIEFLDYNDFLSVAQELLASLDLTGVIQLASFHPQYRFAGTNPDAVENFTNRSPYPMLHLLREASITKVAGDAEFLAGIPERNLATLRALGRSGIDRLIAE